MEDETTLAKKKILRFVNHPAFKAYVRVIGVDPEKLKEDVEWVLENRPDAKIVALSRTLKREKVLTLKDIAYYMPEERGTFKYGGEHILSMDDLRRYFYFTTPVPALNPVYWMLSLALLRHFFERFGEVPDYFFGSVALLRAAHEGRDEVVKEAFKIKKSISKAISWKRVPRYIRELSRLAIIFDEEEYLKKLRMLEEKFSKRKPQQL